jgi:hypothetical protein
MAPAAVARVADNSNQRKSAVPLLVTPLARWASTRFASKGAWKEFEVRDMRIRMLNSDRDSAMQRVRVPAMRTEYASVPTR